MSRLRRFSEQIEEIRCMLPDTWWQKYCRYINSSASEFIEENIFLLCPITIIAFRLYILYQFIVRCSVEPNHLQYTRLIRRKGSQHTQSLSCYCHHAACMYGYVTHKPVITLRQSYRMIAMCHSTTSTIYINSSQQEQLTVQGHDKYLYSFPYCPACRTSLHATRFWVVMICPIIKCLTVLEFSFILFDLCLFITIFNFILKYVLIVTFWILTYHKIWILLIIFCFIWSYWIIYFLTCLEVFWSVVS